MIGRYEKSLRRMVRPKDGIGRYEDVFLKICWRMLRRLLIGWDEDVFLEIVRRMLRRLLIGWDIDVVLEIVQRMLQRLLIDWDKATCPYDNASDLSSCQTDLIGREGNLVFSSWTRLIGLSDGLVLLRTLMIGRSADLLSASSLGFLVARFQTAKRDWRENDYAKASSLGDKYAVLICSWRQNRKK